MAACRYCHDIGDTYTLGKVLGKGQFGTTRIAVHKETGEKFACKTVSKRKIVSKQVRPSVNASSTSRVLPDTRLGLDALTSLRQAHL